MPKIRKRKKKRFLIVIVIGLGGLSKGVRYERKHDKVRARGTKGVSFSIEKWTRDQVKEADI